VKVQTKKKLDLARVKEIADEISAKSQMEELDNHFADIEFRICTSSMSICRLLCENIQALPLSIVNRIIDVHDFLILLVPLIENPPWTRRNPSSGSWEKIIDHEWVQIKPVDLLKVTKVEGQLWLCLYHLVAKSEFSSRYELNSFRYTALYG